MSTVPSDIRIRYPTREDVETLGRNMRAADAAEVLASGGFTPLEAVEISLGQSTQALAIHIGGELACIAGVAALPFSGTVLTAEPTGAVWLLTTPVVEERPKTFYGLSRRFVGAFLSLYPTLVQYVDARHTKALSYLEHLGFDIFDAVPFGVSQLPFHLVIKHRSPHV